MTTQLITLNEYRKNLSRIWKVSQEKNIRYIVLVHSKPVFEVHPIMSRDENIDYELEEAYRNMAKDTEYQKELIENTKYLGHL